MREPFLPLAVSSIVAAGVGVLVPDTRPLVPFAATLGLLSLCFCLRAPLAVLGYALFVSTLLTRIRMPGVPLLPEQALLVFSVGGLVARGRLDVLLRAARLLPRPTWLFVVWGAVVSILRSPDVAASLKIVGWIASSLLVASLIAVLCVGRDERVAPTVGRLASLASISALMGIVSWVVASLNPGATFGVQIDDLTAAPAAYGLSHEANIFGGICAIWLVLDVLYVRRARLVSSAAVRGLLWLGVLVSLTRAAVLGALIGLVVGALATGRSRRIGASMLFVAGLGVGCIFFVGPTVPVLRPLVEKGAQLVDLESSSSVVRRQSWDLALGDMSLGNALLGQGINSFGQRNVDPTRPSEAVPGYLGNIFLQVIYDVGMIGTAMLGAAAFAVARRLSPPDARVLGVLACGAVVGTATSPLWFANWWVVVGLAALAAHRPGGSFGPYAEPPRSGSLVRPSIAC